MSLNRIEPVPLGDPAVRALRAKHLRVLVAAGIYTREDVEAMASEGKVTASWMSLGTSGHVSFGAWASGALVGAVDLWRLADGEVWVLENFFIDEFARRRGFARELFAYARAYAFDGQGSRLQLYSMVREPDAVAFWTHLLGQDPTLVGELMIRGVRHDAVGWEISLRH